MQYLMHSKYVELKDRLTGAVKDRLTGEEGATAVEYGVMVAAIIAVIVALVFIIGQSVSTAFQTVETELS